MGEYIFYSIFGSLIIPVIIIIAIYVFIRSRFRKNEVKNVVNDENWYLQLSLSREDSVSQFLILISVFLLGVTILAVNREIGGPMPWQVVVLTTSLIGLGTAYWLKLIYTLAFSLIGVLTWWGVRAAEWLDVTKTKPSVYLLSVVLIMVLFYLIGRLHEKQIKFKRFGMIYFMLGLIGMTAVLFFMSTQGGLSYLETMTKGNWMFASWQLTIAVILITASMISSLVLAIYNKLISVGEVFALILFTLIAFIISFLPEQSLFIPNSTSLDGFFESSARSLNTSGLVWAVIFNIITFFEVLGIILLGYFRREAWLINLGLVVLFFLIIIKYFDWFFSFLDKSIFFIGAGIILFAVGFGMERGRRIILSNIKNGQK